MKTSRRSGGRSLGALATGAIAGAAVTFVALRVTGLLVPIDLRGSAFSKFVSTYEALHNEYYRPVSSASLLNGAVQGMVDALGDPFSDYFPPVGETQFQNTLSSAYVGIGAVVQEQGGYLTIQSVIAGSPAQKAGLKPQDAILAIDGQSIVGMDANAATNLIVGKAGTLVHLSIRRTDDPGKVLHVSVRRALVTAPEVFSKMLPHQVGYVRLTIVGQNSASQVEHAIGRLRHQGASRLIFDLRGNPGGYLDQAEQLANFLIPKGKVVVQVQGRTGPPQKTLSQGPGLAMPIAVLMDRGTASAAEILSAALHDDVGAPLIGTRSFGKGTAQTSAVFSDGSGMKYTVAKWLTPTGRWIHHVGLQPTDAVSLPSYASLPALDVTKHPLVLNQVSQQVETLQKVLTALGYQPDRTDGYFDVSTERMVERFQQDEHLKSTGSVDATTAERLNVQMDTRIQKSDTQLAAAERVVQQMPLRRP